MAPEVCDTSNYSARCDIYSWAIVFWQLLAKKTMPYGTNMNKFRKSIRENKRFINKIILFSVIMTKVSVEKLRPAQLTSCPEIFRALLYRSWHSDPFERPSLDFIKKILRLFLRQLPSTSCQYQLGPTTDDRTLISLDKYRPFKARSHIAESIGFYDEHCRVVQEIAKLKKEIELKKKFLKRIN